jgi:hypothetical protein
MTETARSVLIDAFEDIVTQGEADTIDSNMARTGIRAMNRLMSTLDATGIALGYTKVDSLNDPITIADGAIDPIIALLAYRLWPKYRTPEPGQLIASNAREALKVLAKIAVTVSPTRFPSTLPRGTGNTDRTVDTFDNFYPELESTILSESNGSISLEDNTDD